jgi:hypothetical protein
MTTPPILKGTLPSVATPTALWLLVVATEELRLPSVVFAVTALVIFFGSFAHLIRIQFARRQRNSDVAGSFVLAELLGLVVVGSIMLALAFV